MCVAKAQGIYLKKKYGQHFLRDESVTQTMIDAVDLDAQSSVFEIGCGDGFLTKQILKQPIARLWVFEIDPEWATYVRGLLHDDPRLLVYEQNILDLDFKLLEPHKPWTLLANLPYQVTFPTLHLLQRHCDMLPEGVVMVQHEVAEKIIKTSGRGYGYVSLFFQYYFEWKQLCSIPPSAFYPPPKVYSALLYFKPRVITDPIPDGENFWIFIKKCFHQPRRTLKNNLVSTHYPLDLIPQEYLTLRAQQMNFTMFRELWDRILS